MDGISNEALQAEIKRRGLSATPDIPDDVIRQEIQRRKLSPTPQGGVSDSMSWSDVPGKAMSNAWPSAKQFGSDMVQPFIHPVDTAKSLGSLGLGVIEKLIPGQQADEATADAVGKFFVDRYGSVEGVKKTLANDPVGALADLATILTGGGALAAKAPALTGQVARVATPAVLSATKTATDALSHAGQMAQRAGSIVDPLTLTGKAAQLAGKGIGNTAKYTLGLATGAGPRAVGEAFSAGVEGGSRARAFQGQMRGSAPIEAIVTDARTALDKLRRQRGDQYRQGMAGVAADITPLSFDGIDAALRDVADVGSYKGQSIKPKAAAAMEEITKAVDDWKQLDPAEFHTAEGLDALKQKIGDIGKSYDPQTQGQARIIADQVYNAIRSEIVKQAPDYANVMKGYEKASDMIKDIDKTLSVNPKANVDTTARKLQSVIRDNVNTNYGRRADLAEILAANGAPNLIPEIAGQAMSSITPRGIQGAVAIPTALGAMATNPALLPGMLAASPRVVGEGAYYAGKGKGAVQSLVQKLLGNMNPEVPRIAGQETYQAGRISQDEQQRLTNLLMGLARTGQSPAR